MGGVRGGVSGGGVRGGVLGEGLEGGVRRGAGV